MESKCTCDKTTIKGATIVDSECPIHGTDTIKQAKKIAPNEQVEFLGEGLKREVTQETLEKGKSHVATFLSNEFRRRFHNFDQKRVMDCWDCIDAIEYIANQNNLVWDKELQMFVPRK